MPSPSQNKQGSVYLFGEKSKPANWLLNHPFHIAACFTFIPVLIFIHNGSNMNNIQQMMCLIILPSFFFGLALLVRFLGRYLCYRIEIDTEIEKIIFYRCFNKGIVEAPIHSVQFVFDKSFACLYRGERFTFFNEYMHEISEVLPLGMEIKFSRGVYERFMKKQVGRNRRRAKSNNPLC